MKNFFTFLYVIVLFSITISAQNEQWETYFEKSGFLSTPNYQLSVEYFKKLEDASPFAKMFEFGITPQGRPLYCMIISKDMVFTPTEVKKLNKPIVLIMNGIHAGEIEGKDASMILLREILITKEKENLIDSCVLLVIPVFNIDGHERISPYNRINQNGPEEMGWRTTAQNLNLNRDFTKADAPEMKAFLKLFNEWLPDFWFDVHTTNGADYQYTITYAIETDKNTADVSSRWINNAFLPYVLNATEKAGYLIAPYVDFRDGDPKKGLIDWVTPPRFSHGYAAARNRPGLLIETHMLKPYKERVFSTIALITASLQFINRNHKELIEINVQADKERIEKYYFNKETFPLVYESINEPDTFLYKGIESIEEKSWVTGNTILRYIGEKYEIKIPLWNKFTVKESIIIPEAYLIPKEFQSIIEIAKLHGINIDVLDKNTKFSVEKIRFKNIKFPQNSFEGRTLPEYEYDLFPDTVEVPKGTFYIPTNQRTLPMIVYLFEPKSTDSFVKWGFFNSIFERKEYFESYSMEPIARKMAKENPELKEEFLRKIESDEQFAKNPRARLNFFYERSPYFDSQYNLYPVMRVIK